MSFSHYAVQPLLCLLVPRVALFFGAKSRGVIVATAVDDAGGMFDVQHFVKDYVLDEPLGHLARIQGLADGDGIVSGIMMAKDAAGSSLRPG